MRTCGLELSRRRWSSRSSASGKPRTQSCATAGTCRQALPRLPWTAFAQWASYRDLGGAHASRYITLCTKSFPCIRFRSAFVASYYRAPLLTLLGFRSLEESLDLCVIRMIAQNGNADSACRRNGLRDLTDRSRNCSRLEGRRSPRHVDGRTLLTKQRSHQEVSTRNCHNLLALARPVLRRPPKRCSGFFKAAGSWPFSSSLWRSR
jgi:hypothetical protein